MRFAAPIKFFQACCITAAIVFGMMRAEAQTNVFAFPAIGITQKVTDYGVKNVNIAYIFAWVYGTNGTLYPYGSTVWYASNTNPLLNKIQLDSVFTRGLSNEVLYSVCTNKNPLYDKSKGVVVYVSADIGAGGQESQDVFYNYSTIQLIHNPDNSYSVPDLSSFSTVLNDFIPFYVPNLQWARVEIGNKGDSSVFEVDDVLYDPQSNLVGSDGFLYLSTDYITDSSSTNGDFWMKISTFDSKVFQICNGDGNAISETPMVLAMNQNGTNATVTVNGGDSGWGFVLQSSADLKAWTNCSPVTFISPTNDLPNAVPSQFIYPSTNRSLFFRTATTNLPPT